jgi:hypothetical protein
MPNEAHMAEESDDPAFPPSGLGNNLPLVELETLLNRPPSRRKRLAQIGLMLAAAVVMLFMLWAGLAPGKPTTFQSKPVTLTPVLLILSNTNYGRVTVNGVQQPGQVPLLIGLRAEPSYAFDITLDAPPFLPVSCRARFLGNGYADSDDHCRALPNTSAESMTINGATVLPAFEVDFSLTLNDLPPDQQRKVTAALTQALTYRQDMTVPAGSYFATGVASSGKISSRRASVPLRASAIVAPFTAQQDQFSGDCSGFICTAGYETQTAHSSSEYLWNILVTIAVRWRFSSASGAAISDVQFQETTSVMLLLAYDGAGDWFIPPITLPQGPVTAQLTSAFCTTGLGMLGLLEREKASVSLGTAHDQGAAGCELILDVNSIDQGLYLWRFGVLLAADARARAAHPELPVAPPEELAAVEQP